MSVWKLPSSSMLNGGLISCVSWIILIWFTCVSPHFFISMPWIHINVYLKLD
uniref:Uncharacterized protein n=1 Tax=Arundo donax TaxID=35708 RepID=A0A0A9H812_ARUDO